MKHIIWTMFIVSALTLVIASCSSAATATPIPVISLDETDASAPSQVQASAVVVPAREARLSFVLSGLVEEVAVREGDQVQAGQTLISLDTSDLEYELVAAQAALTSVELDAQLQRQRRKRFNFDTFNFVYVSPPREKIVIADAKVEQKQSALEIVKASIAQGTLTAPFEGTVVELNVSSGEYIQPTQVVVVIADLQNVYIETTDLSELNVASVEVGQPATVYVEALDDEFPGEVTAISPISDTIGGDVVYKVTVQLDEQPIDLLWGMSADVEIDVD
jgi:RND family efflux transporter MFP subunit